MDKKILKYYAKRNARLDARGKPIITTVKKNFDAPDDEGGNNKKNNQQKNQNNNHGHTEGYHGNTRLPFGLCKHFGIEIGKNWTPKDAWEALKKKYGVEPEDVFDDVQKHGNANKTKKGVKDSSNELAKFEKVKSYIGKGTESEEILNEAAKALEDVGDFSLDIFDDEYKEKVGITKKDGKFFVEINGKKRNSSLKAVKFRILDAPSEWDEEKAKSKNATAGEMLEFIKGCAGWGYGNASGSSTGTDTPKKLNKYLDDIGSFEFDVSVSGKKNTLSKKDGKFYIESNGEKKEVTKVKVSNAIALSQGLWDESKATYGVDDLKKLCGTSDKSKISDMLSKMKDFEIELYDKDSYKAKKKTYVKKAGEYYAKKPSGLKSISEGELASLVSNMPVYSEKKSEETNEPSVGPVSKTSWAKAKIKSTVSKSLKYYNKRRKELAATYDHNYGVSLEKREEYCQKMRKIFKSGAYRMRINAKDLESILNSTFKNQIELAEEGKGSSCGWYSPTGRKSDSHNHFGTPKDTEGSEYEKFGYFGLADDVDDAKNNKGPDWYGDVVAKFKESAVGDRTTYTIGDSLHGDGVGIAGKYATHEGIYNMFSVTDYLNKTKSPTIKSLLKNVKMGYLEIQYHGKLTMDDVESLTFTSQYKYDSYMTPEIEKRLKEKGIIINKTWEKA